MNNNYIILELEIMYGFPLQTTHVPSQDHARRSILFYFAFIVLELAPYTSFSSRRLECLEL